MSNFEDEGEDLSQDFNTVNQVQKGGEFEEVTKMVTCSTPGCKRPTRASRGKCLGCQY
jgi:hypothetical protein